MHRPPAPTELWDCGLLMNLHHSPALSLSLSGLNKLWLICFSPTSTCLSVKLSSETAQREKSRGCVQSELCFLKEWSDKVEAGKSKFITVGGFMVYKRKKCKLNFLIHQLCWTIHTLPVNNEGRKHWGGLDLNTIVFQKPIRDCLRPEDSPAYIPYAESHQTSHVVCPRVINCSPRLSKRDGQRVRLKEGGAGRFRWCFRSSHHGEIEAGWPGDNCICQQSRFLAAIPVQRLLLPCSPGNYSVHKYPTASVLFVHLTLPAYLLFFFLPQFPLYLFPLFVLSSFCLN